MKESKEFTNRLQRVNFKLVLLILAIAGLGVCDETLRSEV